MILLAIESSGLVASIAIMSDDTLIGEYTTNFKKTHSQTLLPMMNELVQMTGISMKDVDAIVISGGPGSFTGLRIGAATAKGLGLALEKPLVNVPTVDALAYNLYGTDQVICPIMDARRQQVYTGLYTFEGDDFKVLCEQKAVSIEEIVEEINALGRPVIFLGDGVSVNKKFICEHIHVPCSFAPAHLNAQRAGALVALGKRYYEAGRIETADEHVPEYLRLSQAERELQEKQNREAGV
ncbi:MAG: tRNA (adenosine(37)-N6)-threonylcarbamoyltransferase complex dimerization subunit type 1 TsaB [Lachnospiraceae bacterium]|nr:tRNA (adenosine(37)-N6)-threonylcarbamoyltransferase complex dimerization subunit type 1 TsaB [Lachnospiraceae bacterium]